MIRKAFFKMAPAQIVSSITSMLCLLIDRAAHLLEVRAVRRGGRYILRFRDDCKNFDPTKYAELHKKGDSAADHIGLRMVMSMVDEAAYINALGLNNLTLEITA